MDDIKNVEEEDMVAEEESPLSAIIVVSKDILPEIANYLPRSTVTIVKLRTMS